jgi:hypothetical protein
MTAKARRLGVFACGAGGTLLAAAVVALAISSPAAATVQFATDTGKACGECHVSPSGGGKLTAFGEKFKANGNKLPKKGG